jgi:hypothetical protein
VFPAGEPTLSCVSSVAIECGDCGHSRWRKPNELYRAGFKPDTEISEMGSKLYCSQCREDGLPGKNIVIQAAFVADNIRARAEAYTAVRSQKARVAG